MSYKHIPKINPNGNAKEQETIIKKFLSDIASRREFRHLHEIKQHTFNSNEEESSYGNVSTEYAIEGLRLHGAQIFIKTFMNPNTPYDRIVLSWGTGYGKTIAAISISQQFIESYRIRREINSNDTPTVFVIGFTKSIIQDAMLKHPSFVSPDEIETMNLLKAKHNKLQTKSSYKDYVTFVSNIKRRFTNKNKGGYYRFMGYREFSNKLFIVTRKGIANKFSVLSLYKNTDEDDYNYLNRIQDAIDNKYLEVNMELVNELKNGLIISDEIHNTYNTHFKNNYGIALQYILDYLGELNVSPKAVFMTATIINGNITEIVSFMNLLIPRNYLPGNRRLTKDMFFKNGKLLPGAADKIGMLMSGRVSFLLDNSEDSDEFPNRIFEGDTLINSIKNHPNEKIPFIKFIKCPMSKLHYDTLKYMIKNKEKEIDTDDDRITVRIVDQTIYDMVYPNPDSDTIGLYDSIDTPYKIMAGSKTWKQKTEIEVTSNLSGTPDIITGGFLNVDKIDKYSSKYSRLINDLLDIIKNNEDNNPKSTNSSGKIMIYHNWVKMSGANQIQSLLLENGFLDEMSIPRQSTLCNICGTQLGNHKKIDHKFIPCRFIIVTSDIDKNNIIKSISRFNNIDNVNGEKYRIIIASKLIREGYDFNALRYQMIMSAPINIAMFIQLIGRGVRRGSHNLLEHKKRNVKIRTYVSTGKVLNPEVDRYHEKMVEYMSIREIERSIRKYSINSFIQDSDAHKKETLELIKYTPILSHEESLQLDEKNNTFYAYDYSTHEINEIKLVISKLFDRQIIWKYKDLIAAVSGGSIKNARNNFIKNNIIIAIQNINSANRSYSRI
jgi:superfamily II DNA or RNA helicase